MSGQLSTADPVYKARASWPRSRSGRDLGLPLIYHMVAWMGKRFPPPAFSPPCLWCVGKLVLSLTNHSTWASQSQRKLALVVLLSPKTEKQNCFLLIAPLASCHKEGWTN